MATKKKPEDKIAEAYFNPNKNAKKLTEKNYSKPKTEKELLRNTTEKITKKTNPSEKITTIQKITKKKPTTEIVEKKQTKRKKTAKKKKATKKKTTAKKTYKPQKIELKENGFELIITEKPQAALKIATALGEATKRELTKGVPYYEVKRNGKKIIVGCAVGHLFTLTQQTPGSDVPHFDIDWVPNYIARKGDFSKKYHDTLLKLAKNAGSLTVATDFDVEGEVIGTNVVRLICGQTDAKRMKFSTLTKKELNNAYENKLNSIFWGQETAGETRHVLDWYYGINLSRALMNAIKTTGKFKIMSIGRVQGPTLALIIKKEREIKKFKSEPYWQIFITIQSPKTELKYTKDIFNKKELKQFNELIGKEVIAETKEKEEIIQPGVPFNLTTLQTEAYKFHGITPSNTLKAAQSLYLAGLISYPRTSSQQLPDSIDYKTILKELSQKHKISHLLKRNKPIQGKKTDPAHPSIYPTGNSQILSGNEEKVYNLILKRFIALFCEDAIISKKKITTKYEKLTFAKRGQEIKKKGWMEIYPTKTKEETIPTINGKVKITNKREEEKETQPPKRYSQASILSELEKRNLGTKATRAQILETLYDRGYIREKSIEATPLGISLIETMEKYSPIIIDEKLTKEIQDEMDKMAEKNTKPLKEKEKIIEKTKKTILKIVKDFEQNENLIGKELMKAQEKQREIEKEENKITKCPNCKEGYLAITYSPKNRKFFIACNAYPKCKTTYSLPPNGKIKKTDKICEKCGFPMLMTLRKGKTPWYFCFNTDCETNKERIEEYRKKMLEKNN